jgi:hypothetical protein
MRFGEEFLTHKRMGTAVLAPIGVCFHAGDIRWTPSSSHLSLTNYEVRIRAFGSSTVVAAINVGLPPIWATTGLCYANISGTLGTLAAGDYTSSVAAVSSGGTTDSAESPAFALPLQ